MIYACGDQPGIAYANGAPNLSADVPALVELADQTGSPYAARTKTGQTS